MGRRHQRTIGETDLDQLSLLHSGLPVPAAGALGQEALRSNVHQHGEGHAPKVTLWAFTGANLIYMPCLRWINRCASLEGVRVFFLSNV